VLDGARIFNNKADWGGGILTWAGNLEISGGEIYGNEAVNAGGGVFNNRDMTITGGEIYLNHVTNGNGGGIATNYGTTQLSNVKIYNNIASQDGGGIEFGGSSGGGELSGTAEISSNSAGRDGGGVYIDYSKLGALVIGPDVVFSGNTAGAAYNIDENDQPTYDANVEAAVWTEPFTQGYNNYDISYTEGEEVDVGGSEAIATATKTADKTTAEPGDEITYTTTLTAAATQDAGDTITDITFKDFLPAGLTLVHDSVEVDGAPVDDETLYGGAIKDALAPGEAVTVTFTATVNENTDGIISNTAHFSYTGSDGTPVTVDTNAADVEATGDEEGSGELTVTKTADVEKARPGDLVHFTLEFIRAGASNRSPISLKVADALPAGLTLVSGSVKVNDVSTPDDTLVEAGENLIEDNLPADTPIAVTLTYTAMVDDDATPGAILKNRATFVYIAARNNGALIPEVAQTNSADVEVEGDEGLEATVTFLAAKNAIGAELEGGEFEFGLYDADGELVATATNGADGLVSFDDVKIAVPGEYDCTIREITAKAGWTADTTEYPAHIFVGDDGKAIVTYPDGYSPVFKNTAESETCGLIEFPELTFDAPGDYEFDLAELTPSGGGWTTDDTTYRVIAHVVEDSSGNLVATLEYPAGYPRFVNIYGKTAKIVLSACKIAVGAALTGGEFEFGLFDVNDATGDPVTTATNGPAEATLESAGLGALSSNKGDVCESCAVAANRRLRDVKAKPGKHYWVSGK
jgi:uncharacterized repeat protein (TIGR01451 family)/pilin isopeptide linkage protein